MKVVRVLSVSPTFHKLDLGGTDTPAGDSPPAPQAPPAPPSGQAGFRAPSVLPGRHQRLAPRWPLPSPPLGPLT